MNTVHAMAEIKERQQKLMQILSQQYPDKSDSLVILFSGFEPERNKFRVDPAFYYLTGINEPSVVCVINLAQQSVGCFVPHIGNERTRWMGHSIYSNSAHPEHYGLDFIEVLGKPCKGYQCPQYFSCDDYESLISYIQEKIDADWTMFVLYPSNMQADVEQRFFLNRLNEFVPGFKEHIIDISSLIGRMRRKKSKPEIEKLFHAIEITINAQEIVAQEIKAGIKERDLQALIEYIFTVNGAQLAFPSIVASGKASTILHYHENNAELAAGDLVIIDIGAEYQLYCADLTRTYPVSKTFTKSQLKYYELVLQAQEYIANSAQPGYWLSNKDQPEKSLQHLTIEFFKKHNVYEHFWHGIGHFLGLDVHDVGNVLEPLDEGDVITIEPGLYIPEQQIGIRIEDDYWITSKGAICLSEGLEKTPDIIEKMMKS